MQLSAKHSEWSDVRSPTTMQPVPPVHYKATISHHNESFPVCVVYLGRLGVGWIAVAQINWLAPSDDLRMKINLV